MGKRGGKKHMKRIATPKAIPVHDKKAYTWIVKSSPGPHPKKYSMPLAVFMRDIIKIAKTQKEVKKILSNRLVQVDGRIRISEKFPVGLMDVVSIPKSDSNYRIMVDRKGRLFPLEIGKEASSTKLLKIVKKHTLKGAKINVMFHDGKNMIADNHLRVGDSVLVSLPVAKIKNHLKREIGARCLVIEGKHAGILVKLKEIINRAGGKPPEALVQEENGGEFITIADYLFVVDADFKGEAS
ncbi:30S ribosomal protein S4e [Candidatus Micrarchaeota archaeon]|nr:30S ribosomal protein S4e [Candidatus Micrarchaeota archaeon]